MPYLPLHHHGLLVNQTLVDVELLDLPQSLRWNLSLPQSLYRAHHDRPDVVYALLRDDPSFLKRCHPSTQLYYQGRSLSLRLSRIALRPELVQLIQQLTFQQKDTLSDISAITAPIRRCIFLNSNRCDCRRENLREITATPPVEPFDRPLLSPFEDHHSHEV